MKSLVSLLVFMCLAVSGYAAGSEIVYVVEEQSYAGYYISPGKTAPLVILVHDWDGLTGYEVKRAEMLAELGYAVFAVDLFGKGVRPTEVKDKRQHTGELYQDRAKMRRLMTGALNEARRLGARVDNAVVMGYCFGGAAVLEFARSGVDLKGFVSFHGGLATPEGQDHSRTKGSLLVFHGSADTAISMEQFAGLAVELEQHGVPHEMTSYGGAPHAFTVFGSDRYREDADRKSWRRFVAYLEETLR